jgi:hypothetical protein
VWGVFFNQGGTTECPFVPEARGLLTFTRELEDRFGWMTLVEED